MQKYSIIILISLCSGISPAQVPVDDPDDFGYELPDCALAATDPWYGPVVRLLKHPGMRWDSLLVRSHAALRQGDSIVFRSQLSVVPAVFPMAVRELADGVINRIYCAYHRDVFYLSLTTIRDTIIAAGFTCDYRLIYSMIDSARMQEAITNYARLYGVAIASNDTFMLPLETHLHSYYCGMNAGTSVEYNRLLRRVRAKDRATLQRWLRCMKPELQVFGALGLLYLQSIGMEISREDETIIALLKDSDMIIAGCEGCMFGTQKPVKEALSEKEIQAVLLGIGSEMMERK